MYRVLKNEYFNETIYWLTYTDENGEDVTVLRTKNPDEMLKTLCEHLEDVTFDASTFGKMPDYVNAPPHYTRNGAMECIEEMKLLFGKQEVMSFCKLNAWKYRYRAVEKNGIEDIYKSDWYMNKYKELREENFARLEQLTKENRWTEE